MEIRELLSKITELEKYIDMAKKIATSSKKSEWVSGICNNYVSYADMIEVDHSIIAKIAEQQL